MCLVADARSGVHRHLSGTLLGAAGWQVAVSACEAVCRLRDAAPEFAEATCLAIACPACMTLELAKSCTGYVTTIINNTDIVPNISPGPPYAQLQTILIERRRALQHPNACQ